MARASGRKRTRRAAAEAPGEPSASAPRTREESGEFPPALGLLEVAVPMWIERLRPMTWEERMKRRDACLAVLATGKDEKDCLEGVALLACGARGKPGQVAEAFNRLAEALALGALQPGGVKFAGMQWDASGATP